MTAQQIVEILAVLDPIFLLRDDEGRLGQWCCALCGYAWEVRKVAEDPVNHDPFCAWRQARAFVDEWEL